MIGWNGSNGKTGQSMSRSDLSRPRRLYWTIFRNTTACGKVEELKRIFNHKERQNDNGSQKIGREARRASAAQGGDIAKVTAHEPKVEAEQPKVALEANVMSAIQASVEVAMKAAVGTILEQLKPATLPSTPAPAIPVRNAGAPNPAPVKPQNYVPKLQGIPVEPHQDLETFIQVSSSNGFRTLKIAGKRILTSVKSPVRLLNYHGHEDKSWLMLMMQ